MSTRKVLVALTGAAVIIAAPACGSSTHQTAASSPSAATPLASTSPAPAAPQSACADLGGTVGPDQTCHVRSTTPTYTLTMSFPLDYPDQKALTDVLKQDRDKFVDWVAEAGSHGRGTPYQHEVTAKTYRSGTSDSGTQSVVLKVQDDTGAAHEAHPNTWFAALNYDLGTRTAITFGTLFKPEVNPLEVLNPIVLHELQKKDTDSPVNDLDEHTYENFAVTNDAVIFFFGEDEVIRDNNGPHQVSVPRAELASILA
ncbi:esterase [Mycobacterium sp. MMS18-G62]